MTIGVRAAVPTAEADTLYLAECVRSFRKQVGRMPTSLHELMAPATRIVRYELPRDPWQRDYELRGTLVVSAGPNGVFGDDDDVSATIHDR